MTADEWQAFVTREAAMEIGRWLEGRGKLAVPVSALTLADLEAMASAAICRFILLGSDRIRARPEDDEDLSRLLPGQPSARSASARRGGSAIAIRRAARPSPITASARGAARTSAPRRPKGPTA
jgi:hypothetical protein